MVRLAIVDDKKHIRDSLQTRLNHRNDITIVFTAVNGKDFLKKLHANNELPSHVIMDIEMPEMTGIEAIERAKVTHPNIEFFVFTVFPDDDNLLAAIQAGASGYFLKEESTDIIIDALTQPKHGGSPLSAMMAHVALRLLKQLQPTTINKPNHEDMGLTPRESEILKQTVDGLTYTEIGEKLFISPATVRSHIQNIYAKLHVNSKAAAIKLAIHKKWFN